MNSIRHTAHKEWVVTLGAGTEASQARAALAKAGLRIEHVLGEIGVITGHGGAELGEALRKIKGVADVAEQAPIDVGPPDSPVS